MTVVEQQPWVVSVDIAIGLAMRSGEGLDRPVRVTARRRRATPIPQRAVDALCVAVPMPTSRDRRSFALRGAGAWLISVLILKYEIFLFLRLASFVFRSMRVFLRQRRAVDQGEAVSARVLTSIVPGL